MALRPLIFRWFCHVGARGGLGRLTAPQTGFRGPVGPIAFLPLGRVPPSPREIPCKIYKAQTGVLGLYFARIPLLPTHPHQSPACQCIIAHLRHAGRAGTPSSELSLARVDHPSAAGAIFGPPVTRRHSSSGLRDNSTTSVSTPSGRCREGILNGRRYVFRSSLGPAGRGGGDFRRDAAPLRRRLLSAARDCAWLGAR